MNSADISADSAVAIIVGDSTDHYGFLYCDIDGACSRADLTRLDHRWSVIDQYSIFYTVVTDGDVDTRWLATPANLVRSRYLSSLGTGNFSALIVCGPGVWNL